jgi:hypothetical protein
VKRSESYVKTIDPCAGDCNAHWVRGVSHELHKVLAGAAKGAIASAILAASIAASPVGVGVTATAGENVAFATITGAIEGAALTQIEGNNFSLALVDMDVQYFIGVKKCNMPGPHWGLGRPVDPPFSVILHRFRGTSKTVPDLNQ